MATAGFTCEFCSKWFKTKIGLGVHTQYQHRAEYEAVIQVPKSKTRWSSEELAVRAMNEALLIAEGKTLEMNTELLPLFHNRCREAIKSQRKQKKYKDLVAEYVQSNPLSLNSTGNSSTVLSATPSVNTCFSRSSSLDATSFHVKDGALVNRPITRSQKRLAKASVQDAPIPPDPPEPPPDDLLTSSDSSSNNDLNNSDLILSFRDDFDPDCDD
ncbi:hypothetical protein AVEN_95878-1, partial [Araneus ventricosus]